MKVDQLLRKYFDRRKKSRPGFSLRSLALQLNVSPSYLSRVFNGQRPLSDELLEPLAKALDIELETLTQLQETKPAATKPERKTKIDSNIADWQLMDQKKFDLLRQWFYLPLLVMTKLEGDAANPETFAERLGLAPETVQVALREMQASGILQQQGGQWVSLHEKSRWSSGQSKAQVRQFHDQMMKKAQDQLRKHQTEADFARRLITGITVTANPENIDAARQKIAEFLHEVAEDLMSEPGTEIYQLSAQFFPLTTLAQTPRKLKES